MHILCQIGEFLPKTVQIPRFDACQRPPVSFRERVIDVFPFHGPAKMPETERRVRCRQSAGNPFFNPRLPFFCHGLVIRSVYVGHIGE